MTKTSAAKVQTGQTVSCKYIPVARVTVVSVRHGDSGTGNRTVWMVLADAEGNELERKIQGTVYPEWGFSPNTRFDIF